MRTIQHPGVEIREIDNSQVAPAIAGSKALVMGFADHGEENEVFEFTSRNAFLNYFGQPTNEEEYYFYSAANEILQQHGGLFAGRIPYSNDASDKFYSQVFPLTGATLPISSTSLSSTELTNEGVSGFVEITESDKPTLIATSAVDSLRTGNLSGYTNKIVVINKSRDTLKTTSSDKEIGGIFTTIVTPWNAFANQNMVSTTTPSAPYTNWACLSSISTSSGDPISADYSIPLSGDFTRESISKILGTKFPPFVYDSSNKLDPYYLHQITVAVCRTFEDTNNDNKISVQIMETFTGSLNKSAIDASTGESIYIGDIVNNNSDYIELYSGMQESYLAGNQQAYMFYSGKGNLLSFTSAQSEKTIKYSDITGAMKKMFDKTANIDETQIDIVVDAGISSIANYISSQTGSSGTYEPYIYNSTTDTITGTDDVETWKSIANDILSFCKSTRKDCIGIIDSPRNLVLQGNEKIERPSAPDQLIDTNVIPKLKYISGLNNSYGAGYLIWNKETNEFTGNPIWLPPSCKTVGTYIYTDRVANFWDAPAGMNRGVLYGVVDIAFNPKSEQMDSIYNKSWNYEVSYPLDGIVVEGQKTLQIKPSAFDRVNVRRLFLRLERLAYQVLLRFRYEPNNYFTRRQIVDMLTPVFESVKLKGGLYDYKIVCDESNNTPDVIDRNELKIAILLKPTKTAEYILADFYALSTGASFNEIML